MKATELRIGNWVRLNVRPIENYQVTQILEKGVNCGDVGFLYDMAEPILLTEEWLERFKFNQFDDSDFFIPLDSDKSLILMNVRGYWYPRIQQEAEMSHQYIQEVNLNYIKHVHKLQNLYHALTGQELTIKE